MKTSSEEPQNPGIETPEPDQPAAGLTSSKIEPPAPKKTSRLTRLMRWFLLLMIFFGLGALLVIFLLYLPLRQSAAANSSKLQSELRTSQERVTELEARQGSLQSLEPRNEELEAELGEARQRILLLTARTDVAAARLALTEEDSGTARSLLNGTSKNLENLAKIGNEDQRQAVGAMQQRLKLALEGLEDDPYAAQSDLDVLATQLLQYDHSLLSKP